MPAVQDVRDDVANRVETGLHAGVTAELRAGAGGRMQSQQLGGEEYPPYLYEDGVKRFDRVSVVRDEQITDDQRRQLFAFGSDTGNRNIPDPGRRLQVTMTRPDWVRS